MVRHILLCRSIWQETQRTNACQMGLFLSRNQKSSTQKFYSLLWAHRCKNTRMPLLPCILEILSTWVLEAPKGQKGPPSCQLQR